MKTYAITSRQLCFKPIHVYLTWCPHLERDILSCFHIRITWQPHNNLLRVVLCQSWLTFLGKVQHYVHQCSPGLHWYKWHSNGYTIRQDFLKLLCNILFQIHIFLSNGIIQYEDHDPGTSKCKTFMSERQKGIFTIFNSSYSKNVFGFTICNVPNMLAWSELIVA